MPKPDAGTIWRLTHDPPVLEVTSRNLVEDKIQYVEYDMILIQHGSVLYPLLLTRFVQTLKVLCVAENCTEIALSAGEMNTFSRGLMG